MVKMEAQPSQLIIIRRIDLLPEIPFGNIAQRMLKPAYRSKERACQQHSKYKHEQDYCTSGKINNRNGVLQQSEGIRLCLVGIIRCCLVERGVNIEQLLMNGQRICMQTVNLLKHRKRVKAWILQRFYQLPDMSGIHIDCGLQQLQILPRGCFFIKINLGHSFVQLLLLVQKRRCQLQVTGFGK
ncbi:hypothetical protein D3C80_1132040 [compost metagenome]